MHAQRGLQYLVCHAVCLSVCLLPRLLPLHATRWPISDTNGFSGTLALFCETAAFKSYGVKQSEGANMQISTGLPQPAEEAPEVATQGKYRLLRAI